MEGEEASSEASKPVEGVWQRHTREAASADSADSSDGASRASLARNEAERPAVSGAGRRESSAAVGGRRRSAPDSSTADSDGQHNGTQVREPAASLCREHVGGAAVPWMEEQLQRDGWASRQMPGSGGDRVLPPHTARRAAMHCQRREVEVGGTAPFTAEGDGGEGGVVDGWVLSTAVGDMDIGVGAGAGMAVREGVSRGDCAVQQVSSFTALQRAATTTAAATSAGYHSTTSSIVTAAGYSSSSGGGGGGGGGAGSVLLLERYVAAVEERNRIGRAKLQQARRAVELQVREGWVGG